MNEKKTLMIHIERFSSGRIEVLDYGMIQKSEKNIFITNPSNYNCLKYQMKDIISW